LTDPDAGPGEPQGELARCERARAGDREAFAEIVGEHYPAVRATAFRLVGNPEDAEDLAQECFVRAFRALRFFRGDSPLSAWLRRIVTHLARDRFRREQRARSVPLPSGELEPRTESGPSSAASGREFARLVAAALERLPENLRVALLLRTREELSYEEIADAMGYTPATCRTQVMKARRALLRALGPHLEGRLEGPFRENGGREDGPRPQADPPDDPPAGGAS
jgi:RNA polymerase sigma-70 factor (ECF subfamily)